MWNLSRLCSKRDFERSADEYPWAWRDEACTETAGEKHIDKKHSTLKSDIALEKSIGRGSKFTIQPVPILLDTFWTESKVIPKYPERNPRIMNL